MTAVLVLIINAKRVINRENKQKGYKRQKFTRAPELRLRLLLLLLSVFICLFVTKTKEKKEETDVTSLKYEQKSEEKEGNRSKIPFSMFTSEFNVLIYVSHIEITTFRTFFSKLKRKKIGQNETI